MTSTALSRTAVLKTFLVLKYSCICFCAANAKLHATVCVFLLCIKFLADRTNGRAYATVLRLSSVQNVLLLNGAS